MRKAIPLLVGVVLVFGCATPRPDPPPRAAAVAPPAPYVPPAPVSTSTDWRDWPLTPGDWRYGATAGGSTTSYGTGTGAGVLALQCFQSEHAVVLSVDVATAAAATVRTSSVSRTVALTQAGGGTASVRLSASDPLLDAIAFSRGRFVLEAGGHTLVVPVYAEIGRVIEDCRG